MRKPATAYERAVAEFRVRFLLDAVDEADGNICRAMAATGVHRNTIRRVLQNAGYNSRQLRERARERIRKSAMGQKEVTHGA